MSSHRKLHVMLSELREMYESLQPPSSDSTSSKTPENVNVCLLTSIQEYNELKRNLGDKDPLVIERKLELLKYIQRANLTVSDAHQIREELLSRKQLLTQTEIELQTRRNVLREKSRESRKSRKS